MSHAAAETCSFSDVLRQDSSKSSTSWADGISTTASWGRYEHLLVGTLRQRKMSRWGNVSSSTHLPLRQGAYEQMLVPASGCLRADTKQLTKCCLNRGGVSSRGITCLVMTLRQTDHFVSSSYIPCVSMLSSMCLRSMHAWCGRHPQTFAKRSIVSRFTCWDDCKRSRSEASFLGSPAEMIAQCKANEAEKTVKGLIDFAAFQSHTIPWDWYTYLHESLISDIIVGLFLI